MMWARSIRLGLFHMAGGFVAAAVVVLAIVLTSVRVLDRLVLMERAPGEYDGLVHRAERSFDTFIALGRSEDLDSFRNDMEAANAMTRSFSAILAREGEVPASRLASDLADAVPFANLEQSIDVVHLVQMLSGHPTVRSLVANTDEGTLLGEEYLALADQLRSARDEEQRQTVRPQLERIRSGLERASAAYAANVTSLSSWAVGTIRWILWLGFVIVFGAAAVAAYHIARSITSPLQRAVEVSRLVASGDLTPRLEESNIQELDALAGAINEVCRETGRVIHNVAETTEALVAAGEQLSVISGLIAARAEETSAQAARVTEASHEVSSTAQMIASNMASMSDGIREVTQSASSAAMVAQQAKDVATRANASVNELGVSSNTIGDVTRFITEIAEQVNLLALNATIEAARAGSAGKGFAVVAGEVKELASETRRAVEDIDRRVTAIQQDATRAIAATSEIGGIVTQIVQDQERIASSVEQQSSIAGDIGARLRDATESTSEIARALGEVGSAAADTSQGVAQALVAASDLARMATQLSALIERFRW
jgi:methyl-accepting chemotaxis protein